MDFKRICKAMLYPHAAVVILLVPICATLFILSALVWRIDIVTYASYALSAYTLTIVSVRVPSAIRFCRTMKNENKYIKRWFDDARLRVNVSLMASFLWNTGYAAFQLGLGIFHASSWFYSLAAYYVALAIMRYLLGIYLKKNEPGKNLCDELIRYRACGIIFLIMNVALFMMMFYTVFYGRSVNHHEITTIAIAAYTFFTFTKAIINVVKYRKYDSPVFSAAKAISLACAAVSMFTLESTMLETFDDGEMTSTGKLIFMIAGGAAVFAFIIAMAVYMIVVSTKRLNFIKLEKAANGTEE